MTEEALAAVTVALIVLVKRRKERQKKSKSCWVKPWLQRREGRGILNMLLNENRPEDPHKFTSFVGIDRTCFDKLLACIDVHIRKTDTLMRESISSSQRLAVTLRFLATGETYKSLALTHRISVPSISKIVIEVCSAICSTLREKYLKAPSTEREWETIAKEFDELWQFPNCIGAMDGKHIAFSPAMSAHLDNKRYNSIVLLAVVDARYRFTLVDMTCSSTKKRATDSEVFLNSKIGTPLKKNSFQIPGEKVLNGSDISAPHVVVAGNAFRLLPYVMKPYEDCEDEKSKKFNIRLSRARHVVEKAFCILTKRFKILLGTMRLPIEKCELLIETMCVLHNFLIDEADNTYLPSMDTEQCSVEEGSCHKVCSLPSIRQQTGNRTTSYAREVRDYFCEYFSTSGHVDLPQ